MLCFKKECVGSLLALPAQRQLMTFIDLLPFEFGQVDKIAAHVKEKNEQSHIMGKKKCYQYSLSHFPDLDYILRNDYPFS